jgi:hypothetical protein
MTAPRPPVRAPIPAPNRRDAEPLAAILAELRALRADLAALAVDRLPGAGMPETRADDAPVANLLRTIAANIGDSLFCTTDLWTRLPSPASEAVHAAVVRAVGAASPRRLGKLLRRIEGRDIAGLCVRRVDLIREGVVWQIACLRV